MYSKILSKIRDFFSREMAIEFRRIETIRKDFVANVSHELKTPLTNIRGFAETLKQGALQDEKVAYQFLEKIEKNAIQLQELVEDILKLSEIESGRLELSPTPFFLSQITQGLEDDFSERLRTKKLIFQTHISHDFKIVTDLHALKRILSNLLDNAIKYTPEGGVISLIAQASDEFYEMIVADTGIGIPETDLPRVFERFYRVDKSRSREMGGTGLGLAIVKHLVQALGGEIRVSSEPGRGSRFIFTIPSSKSHKFPIKPSHT